MYQAKTLRRMKPETRKLAKQANQAELLTRRLRATVDRLAILELDSLALAGYE